MNVALYCKGMKQMGRVHKMELNTYMNTTVYERYKRALK